MFKKKYQIVVNEKEYTPTEMQKNIVKLLENYQLKWQKEKELKKYDR